jgi:hypothetical protein
LATLGTACVVVGLVGAGFIQQLAGGSSGSTIPADGFELICGVGALIFFLRAMSVPRKDAQGAQPPAKHQKLYVIGGAILAVVLLVAVLFLTGSH